MDVAVADETTVWAACGGLRRHRVLRIDPRDNRVVVEIPIKQGGHVIALDATSVWVTYGTYRPGLYEIDPATNEVVRTTRFSGPPLESVIVSLVADRDTLWMATTGPQLIRMDKRTLQEEARISVPGGAGGVAVTERAVWALSTKGGTLSKIDPQTNQVVRTIPIGISCEEWAGPCHRGPLAAAGSVWVSSYAERTVSRIDPEADRVAVTIPVGLGPTQVTAVDDGIWIDRNDGTRLRIDPGTNQVTARIARGGGPEIPVAEGEFDPPRVHSPRPEIADLEDLMSRAATADPAAPEYRAQGQAVDLEFLTPPVVRKLAMRDETSAHDKHMGIASFTPGKDFFRWSEIVEGSGAVVLIQAIPKFKKISNLEGLAYGDLAALFNPKDRVLQPGFRSMKLLVDGIEVAPIDPGRICGVFKIRLLYPEGDKKWQDQVFGCYGSYAYDPKAFKEGSRFTLKVLADGQAEVFELDRRTVDRIRSDFQRP
jgi:hypothetical protein